MKHIFSIIIAVLLFLPALGFTQTKEIIAEGAYNMGDGETPSVAESRALLQAKRVALEQAGTYVESYSKVKNLKLTEDKIEAIASGIMKTAVVDKKRIIVGNGFKFWIKIKAIVQTDPIDEMAMIVEKRQVMEGYKRVKETYDAAQKEIEDLKKQLNGVKNETVKKAIIVKISENEKKTAAAQWLHYGWEHQLSDDDLNAIKDYSEAISLNPNLAAAYNSRGDAYSNIGMQDMAVDDFNKAISLNPNYAFAYNNRGSSYYSKGQYDMAIEDFNKALSLKTFAAPYKNRGNAYYKLNDLKKACADWSLACTLGGCDGIEWGKKMVIAGRVP